MRKPIHWKKQCIKAPRRIQDLFLIRGRMGDCDKQVTTEVMNQSNRQSHSETHWAKVKAPYVPCSPSLPLPRSTPASHNP